MAQSLGGFAADAPRFAIDLASQNGAYYAKANATGAAGVDSLQTLTGDLTLTSTNASVVFTTSGNNINLSVPGALPGGLTTVLGTANQVGVVTASGTATVALAAPSPAPAPGTFQSANVTVDGFGRVTTVTQGPTGVAVPGLSGTYIGASLGVDAYGRITSAASASQAAVALIYNGSSSGPASGTQVGYAGLLLDAVSSNTNSRVYRPMYNGNSGPAFQYIGGTTGFPMILNHIYRVSISGTIQMIWDPAGAGFSGNIQVGITTNQAGITNATTLSSPNNYTVWAQDNAVFVAGTSYRFPFSISMLVVGQGQLPCLYVATAVPLPIEITGLSAVAQQASTFSYEDLGVWTGALAVPAQPDTLVASEITATAFKIAWNQENPQATANAYTLNGVAVTPTIDGSINSPIGPYVYFTGKTPSTPYTFIVTPSNNLGNGAASAPLVVTTTA